jgi:adenylate kinase family enzyme
VSTTRFVAVLGPPAVGKSTVTASLVARTGARVFRLREFVRCVRNKPDVNQRLFTTDDPLGWLGDGAVAFMLQAAFLDGQFPESPTVVLENFPGSDVQARLLAIIMDRLAARLDLVELVAPQDVLMARRRMRRVCSTCEPDPLGDPHRPARPGRCDPARCRDCGGELRRRPSDHPVRFAARLSRFHERIPAIRAAAEELALPFHTVDASTDAATCFRHIAKLLGSCGTSACSPLLALTKGVT